MPLYKPIVVETRMSKYGWYVVTVSVSPGRRISVMIAAQGITSDQAPELALTALTQLSGQKG